MEKTSYPEYPHIHTMQHFCKFMQTKRAVMKFSVFISCDSMTLSHSRSCRHFQACVTRELVSQRFCILLPSCFILIRLCLPLDSLSQLILYWAFEGMCMMQRCVQSSKVLCGLRYGSTSPKLQFAVCGLKFQRTAPSTASVHWCFLKIISITLALLMQVIIALN